MTEQNKLPEFVQNLLAAGLEQGATDIRVTVDGTDAICAGTNIEELAAAVFSTPSCAIVFANPEGELGTWHINDTSALADLADLGEVVALYENNDFNKRLGTHEKVRFLAFPEWLDA